MSPSQPTPNTPIQAASQVAAVAERCVRCIGLTESCDMLALSSKDAFASAQWLRAAEKWSAAGEARLFAAGGPAISCLCQPVPARWPYGLALALRVTCAATT
jgi:hypothetical protein